MKAIFTALITLVLVGGLVSELLAESHSIEVLKEVQIYGVKLKPGKYQLTLNGDHTAELHKGRKMLVKAQVDTAPLAGATPNSISQNTEGHLIEIRLSDQRVVFVESPKTSRTGR